MNGYIYLRHNFSVPGVFTLLLFSAMLLGGCSNQAPVEATSERRAPIYNGKAAYNRPYTIKGKTYYPLTDPVGYHERGVASWYGAESGRRTAMGSRFRPNGLTAAHKTLPLPCKVKVTNLRNDRSVVVLVNDRGPFKKNRLIDLSQGAARLLGLHGLTEVEVEYLENNALSDNQ